MTDDPGFGIYVHWPFCAAKCPYCDFNSHVRHTAPDQARYVAAFTREIAHFAALTPGRAVRSIFFGGGTPSLMAPETVGAILDAIGKAWTLEDDLEVSLEANPASVDATRFAGYRAAGVNRVSLGVQALDDTVLRFLGRLHTAAEARAAIDVARRTFPRFSFDLIYARPEQSVAQWIEELDLALAEGPAHLSLYQLTIEPDTMFEKLFDAGKLKMPSEQLGREFFDATQAKMRAVGLPAYEISNHARPGEECRHNLVYWRYGDYAGIGPGAHSRLTVAGERRAVSTLRAPEDWLAAVEANGHGLALEERLSAAEQADELLLMGLRLVEGIDPARYAALAGRPMDKRRIADLVGHGFIETVQDRLRVTTEGFPVLDAIVADLAA